VALGPIKSIFLYEEVEPQQLPSILIVAERTELNLEAQNYTESVHRLTVGVIVEEFNAPVATRAVWRYARAIWMTLHDKAFQFPSSEGALGDVYFLVESVDYGVIYGGRQGRQFRKDAVLNVRAEQREQFA
jgi:hypothetical protein